ncbi:MAG: GNAT family N-acetyltransferase [Deltaproteobacteria bacterium]|jgi:ribosomal protein S18 acetylase RimI-like enzyme|nr:GNAT family N-acetyltransferase [Deltaproteobacteria bacterium]
MNISYTPFTLDDYTQVIDLWEKCEGIGLSAADSVEGIEKYLERNPGMSLVARDFDTVVGSILGGHDGRRGYIHHLAVSPAYRRQGVGRKLVEECIAGLQGWGIQKIHIFIFNDNEVGIAFWEQIGWTYRKDISLISKIIKIS